MAQLLLSVLDKGRAGTAQVFGNRYENLVRNGAILVALACAAFACAGKLHAELDIALRPDSGHALLSLGFVSVSVAFDSGRECPNSNGCAGSIL